MLPEILTKRVRGRNNNSYFITEESIIDEIPPKSLEEKLREEEI